VNRSTRAGLRCARQAAKYEKAKIAEHTRQGKLRKAREGRVVCGATPTYGFRYNETRDGLLIHESEMSVVEKIFWLAAVGVPVRVIQALLYTQGIPAQRVVDACGTTTFCGS